MRPRISSDFHTPADARNSSRGGMSASDMKDRPYSRNIRAVARNPIPKQEAIE